MPGQLAKRYSTRSSTVLDERFVAELYAATRAAEVASFGWPAPVAAAFLTQQQLARDQHTARTHPDAEHVLLLVDGAPVGRIVLDTTAECVHVVDLAILPAYQGCGLGAGALTDVLARARRSGLRVRLVVRADNLRARRLYDRFGFVVVQDDGLDLVLEHVNDNSQEVRHVDALHR